ncbi:MAG: hypothetical protein LBH98_09170 [Chitinispirillales bacterium]|jgi:hypothetical protein|nr:hypothetical protein [Chitinispirillales bacterium]
MEQYIQTSFWHALAVVFIVGAVMKFIFRGIPATFKPNFDIVGVGILAFLFLYIWHIRHGVGWLVLGIIDAILFIYSIFRRFYKKPVTDSTLPNEIAEFAKSLNLPKLISADLQMESIEALPGKKILYTYTMINVPIGQTLAQNDLSSIRNELIKGVKTDDVSLARYRENDVTFIYKYMDKEKQGQVGIFEITPSDYKESKLKPEVVRYDY